MKFPAYAARLVASERLVISAVFTAVMVACQPAQPESGSETQLGDRPEGAFSFACSVNSLGSWCVVAMSSR